MGYTTDYWKREGKRISEERRERYANDPEYRAAILAQTRAYREKKRQEREAFLENPTVTHRGKTVPAMTADGLVEALGITKGRLKYLQRKGYIPAAQHKSPVRLYTENQKELVAEMEAYLGEHATHLRSSSTAEGQAAITGLADLTKKIAKDWKN